MLNLYSLVQCYLSLNVLLSGMSVSHFQRQKQGISWDAQCACEDHLMLAAALIVIETMILEKIIAFALHFKLAALQLSTYAFLPATSSQLSAWMPTQRNIQH